ncbi:diacylglycerol kinase [Pullulanibacillus sp. KACC 23026]|uniref:diacylglycerol kinase n=1 Tax=Pullulanibacillus sp. KACC 23026 TaxID=3028315 RepID=UPI0023B11189|nr:diacylglycerol kinase [Pullulanibacillus sp. KACC 23026]WEG12368.1 diacylglycerol kinase [Pullulanibacillus sp. KACC 23026]
MRRARLIYNPTSGRETIKKNLPYILDRLERGGWETSCHATTGIGDATKASQAAVEREFDLVIAAGGDGTINEVINGLCEQSYRPRLAIIPTGTTNDFARAICVPRDIEAACDIICQDYHMPLDVGKVNGQYFINIAGGGKLTELTYEVPSKLKTMLGQLAYYLKGIEMLPSIRPSLVRIEFDGHLFEDEIMFFLVSNTNSVGGFEKLAPEASMNDGMFDLVILRKTTLPDLIRLARLAVKGEHIKDPNVIYVKANRIRVFNDEKMQLNLDGEYGGELPGEFSNLYQHLTVVVPKEIALNNGGGKAAYRRLIVRPPL